MLNERQRNQLGKVAKFFEFVMENRLKGNFIVSSVGNGDLGQQIKYEGYYNLSVPVALSEAEMNRLLLKED